ncbi:hypothetical protein [Cellulomonas fengjieae]|uniref:Uncharacterized protein n=1 Tax=Cellulomonas fengjieae TaxID=2819978 RepID=A0ABS3SHM6_9CELL|nr:hypothetical protein [Cellulomonas fengjieae]MBO3084470.1 hypothetical protein [Cellulomonas fengjieae]QVI67193.1 hypothetical protein KG102_06340 [Cellulomonas fengjieae]
MTTAIDRDSAFGRWLLADRVAVDALLKGALARGGDADVLRSAVADLAGVSEAFVDAGVLDPALGRALLRRTVGVAARGRWSVGDPDRAAVVDVLPRLTGLLRSQPVATVDAVGGAARAVARAGDLGLFGFLLAAVPEVTDAATVPSAVLVAAWRAGAARFRTAALREAASLPRSVAAAVLGLPAGADPAETLARHTQDPWWWPGFRLEPGVVRRVGGFRGFGGPWVTTPRVVPGGPTGCAVSADGARWAIVADVHGAAVVRLGDEQTPPAPATATDRLPVPWTDRVTGVAGAGGSVLLVSRRHSYWVDAVRVAA